MVVHDEQPEEGYSNPVADLGFQVLTHSSENPEYMEEVQEVNESDLASVSEKEVPVDTAAVVVGNQQIQELITENFDQPPARKRIISHRRDRQQTLTLGDEGNLNEQDYIDMNLISYSNRFDQEQPEEDSEDPQSSENESQSYKSERIENSSAANTPEIHYQSMIEAESSPSEDQFIANSLTSRTIQNPDTTKSRPQVISVDITGAELTKQEFTEGTTELEICTKEVTNSRNYKDALEYIYGKTDSSLSRNVNKSLNIQNKQHKTEGNKHKRKHGSDHKTHSRSDSSLFTLRNKVEKDDYKQILEQNKQHWEQVIHDLKVENAARIEQLTQEMKEKDAKHSYEIGQLKRDMEVQKREFEQSQG